MISNTKQCAPYVSREILLKKKFIVPSQQQTRAWKLHYFSFFPCYLVFVAWVRRVGRSARYPRECRDVMLHEPDCKVPIAATPGMLRLPAGRIGERNDRQKKGADMTMRNRISIF
jgi:hypothetical protein